MTQEFVALPREVVEQALNALWDTDSEGGTKAYERERVAAEALRAALEQPVAGIPASVPAGWKLVPLEPTAGMVLAGERALKQHDFLRLDASYRAMLASAPQPPVAEQPQGEQDPVGKLISDPYEGHIFVPYGDRWPFNEDLYTHPQPKREPLTHQQIYAIAESMPGGLDGFLKGWGWQQFSRAIEAAHNIK